MHDIFFNYEIKKRQRNIFDVKKIAKQSFNIFTANIWSTHQGHDGCSFQVFYRSLVSRQVDKKGLWKYINDDSKSDIM